MGANRQSAGDRRWKAGGVLTGFFAVVKVTQRMFLISLELIVMSLQNSWQ